MLNNIPLELNQSGGGAMVTIMFIFNIIFLLAIIAIFVIIFVPSVNSFFLSKDNSLTTMFPTLFIDDSDDVDDNDLLEEETYPSDTTTPDTTTPPDDS